MFALCSLLSPLPISVLRRTGVWVLGRGEVARVLHPLSLSFSLFTTLYTPVFSSHSASLGSAALSPRAGGGRAAGPGTGHLES